MEPCPPVSAVATAARVPTRVGKYEILAPIAAGGMARIYIARSTGIGYFERHVVLKMILPERATDKHAVDMFLDEARLAAALNHQNVAQVFEVGQEAGIHFLAMEFVHGQDLRAVLSKAGQAGARIPIELSLAIVAGAAAGLHHAHDRRSPDGVPLGIVHRDVSPSNIMIGYDGAVKLLDFGIAKAAARSVHTQSGIIKGKFAYMSPEQCRGREVDRRSDVFALGIILYEITTQHRCFRADSDFDTMHRIVTGDIVRPSRLVATYPPELEKIVMTALSVDVSRRYASCAAMLEEIESFAARARLSPSTMALGRFMRELFGEVPEPWQAGGRLASAPSAPRESTVSNTLDSQVRFGGDAEPSAQIEVEATGGERREPWASMEGSKAARTWSAKASARPDAEPTGPGAAQTLLDLPRGSGEAEDAVDWDAKAYPQAQPTFASQLDVPVERKPSLHGIFDSTPSTTGRAARSTGTRRGLGSPISTSQVVSAAPAISRPTSPTASSSLSLMTPLSDKTSTASAAAVGPLGTKTPGVAEPSGEVIRPESLSVDLSPRRSWLVTIMVVVLIAAFAALVVIWLGGDDLSSVGAQESAAVPESPPEVVPPAPSPETPPPAPSPEASSVTKAPEVAPVSPAPTPDDSQVAPPPRDPDRTVAATVHLQVTSDPKGAEVFLENERLGVTPLSAFVPRRAGTAMLVVKRARYVEASSKINLSGPELVKSFSLRRAPAATSRKNPAVISAVVDDSEEEEDDEPAPSPREKCQRPESANPFDDTPICSRQ
ncbi:MAG: serine/threonine-protein kinase [Kofleriaceae bacterium]